MPIEIKELSFSYDSKPFIDNLDLKIYDGEMVGIIGNTGCGKSTFVRLIAGLIKSDSGKIIIDGDDITNKKFNKKILRRKLGIVFQFPEMQLFEQTIEKDIFFGLKQYKLTYDEKYKRAKEALELLGLDFERIKDKSPLALSGGEKRKIAIAGILVCMHAKDDQILLISMNRQKNQSHKCLTQCLSIHAFFHLLEQDGEAFLY